MYILSYNCQEIINLNDFNRKDKKTPPEEITIQEYDLKQWNEMIKQHVITVLLLSFLHFKFGIIVPLVSQPIVGTMQMFSNNLFKIHILKKNIRRPFPKPESPFGNFAKQD